MKKGDFIIIVLAVLLAAGGFLLSGLLGAGQDGKAYAAVSLDGKEVLRKPLFQPAEQYEIQGRRGVNLIEIGDGSARVVSADCKDQLCVHQGKAQRPNQPIVCLPHRLVLRIVTEQEGGVDAVAE